MARAVATSALCRPLTAIGVHGHRQTMALSERSRRPTARGEHGRRPMAHGERGRRPIARDKGGRPPTAGDKGNRWTIQNSQQREHAIAKSPR